MYMTAGRGFNRSARVGHYRGVRGLGTIATPVAGSMILSSNPVGSPSGGIADPRGIRGTWNTNYRLRMLPPQPGGPGPGGPMCPAWGCGTPPPWQGGGSGWTAGGNPYGSSPLNPTGSQLAIAQSLLQTNPSLLNPTQWQLLQQAGLVASTVPYSSAGQITTSSGGAIDPATGVPYSQELAAAQAGVGATATTASWFTDPTQELISGIPNWALVAAGGVGVYLMMRPAGRR
jgi:hypothetical protein